MRKKKNLKKSLNFTIMVVGQSGCGRSTFINTLCDQNVVETSSSVNDYEDRELQLRKCKVELEDNEGVKINLNIIDSPGFGDLIDNNSSFKVIKEYIKYQFDEILVEESRLRRNPRFKDGRIHVLIYLINATGHGLREIDVEIMKELGGFVNILPCISKSDSLTVEELKLNKQLIREDIKHYKIPIFEFNNEYFSYDENLDDESIELNKYLDKSIPFAVMGSNSVVKGVNGSSDEENHRIRKYPWGEVDVYDNELSDMTTLKNSLLITHLNELKEFTHEVLYENYRTKTLAEGGAGGDEYIEESVVEESVNEIDDLKEEQIRKEEERLRKFEEKVQNDLQMKREEIEARERELAELERRLAEQSIV